MNLSLPSAALTPALPEGNIVPGQGAGGSMYLLFQARGALFGIEAALAHEIHLLPALAPLFQAAPWVLGVLDLRGEFVPVIDLALRLGRARREPQLSDCLILLEWQGEQLGLVVDEVLQVCSLPPEQQESVPGQSQPEAGFVRAIAHLGDHEGAGAGAQAGAVMLLHAERLLQLDGAGYLPPPPNAPGAPGAAHDVAHDAAGAGGEGSFAAQASQADRAVFAQRAQRLRQRASGEERDGLSPFAVIGLGGEQFGIGLEGVREFCSVRSPTPVPCCPPHVVGQMNLRGDILTLLDIRHLLHLAPPSVGPSVEKGSSDRTDNVVVLESGGLLVGVLVDEVLDVLYLRASSIAALPSASPGVGGKYFNGGALYHERMLCLLDLPRILSEGGLAVDESV